VVKPRKLFFGVQGFFGAHGFLAAHGFFPAQGLAFWAYVSLPAASVKSPVTARTLAVFLTTVITSFPGSFGLINP
jgi:hypothetical protein